jgi:MFS family permease
VSALLVPAPPAAAAAAQRRQRLTLAGLVLVITVVAVEAMAVATAMPTVARSLHGLSLFGWSFTAFLLADVVGMVDAGARVDRSGPRSSLVGGLALFSVGLVVDGVAPDMAVFLTGRVLQGLGGGALIVAVYVLVAREFPEQRRPRVFAALSAAWVVPALVGPALAGAVTESVGWRWVFFGIAPLAAVGATLLLPVMRHSGGGSSDAETRLGTAGGVALAVGLALVQAAGQRLDIWSVPLALIGLVLLATPLHRVLPGGSLRLRPGLPTLVVLRGLFSAAFFGAEAYLPLTLTRLHHGSPTAVGIPLTVGALGWSLGSWWQGRGANAARPVVLLRAGFALVGLGVVALVTVTFAEVSMWAAAPLWVLAGAGMGLGYPTLSVSVLRLSPPAEQGANSAALQICDVIGGIAGVSLAATIVAVAGTGQLHVAMRVADLLLGAITLLGIALAARAVRSDVEAPSNVEAQRA